MIGIYFHPEAFPPTLNAISELSECFDHITVIHRPHLHNSWKYPANVHAIASGSFITAKQQEAAPLLKKAGFYAQYVSLFLKHCRKKKPAVILVYDSLSLYAYHLVKRLLRFEHKIWYHNHDVTEPELLRKFSIGWFAARKEASAFDYLDLFSLPTNDRLKYFPMHRFKGRYFFIPNYPSRKFYLQFYSPRVLQQTVRIIFQGHIGPYHGIEEIIPLLQEPLMGHRLELVLKGPCPDDYRSRVLQLADAHNTAGHLAFIGVTPYADVPATGAACHIGIGILAKNDIMNTTLGTASNKIYEYAAVGLPVLYYNSANFTRYLEKYAWALPTDLSSQTIRETLILILRTYEDLSAAAHRDFLHELNFETGFQPAKDYMMQAGNKGLN